MLGPFPGNLHRALDDFLPVLAPYDLVDDSGLQGLGSGETVRFEHDLVDDAGREAGSQDRRHAERQWRAKVELVHATPCSFALVSEGSALGQNRDGMMICLTKL